MLDLIIRGGKVVTPGGVGAWDVAVQGEQIAAIAEPGTLTRDVGRVIDAAGKIVVPGRIEPHALPSPALSGREGPGTSRRTARRDLEGLRVRRHDDGRRLRKLAARDRPPTGDRGERPPLSRAQLCRLHLPRGARRHGNERLDARA